MFSDFVWVGKKFVILARELPAVTGDTQIITIGKQIVLTDSWKVMT